MGARDRRRMKGRREGGRFSLIPHAIQDSPNWRACSGTAIKMLCDLARQYNGNNNGDLCSAILERRGWRHGTALEACRELRHYGFIELTRQGGMNYGASLYALTWHAIDHCGGKLDCAATSVASGLWKEPKPRFVKGRKNGKASTNSDLSRDADRTDMAREAA